jgi:large subunit ribosomal protein L10e
MGLRPGRCYRSLKDRPYSRYAVRVHKKNFIGAVPGLKIRQFNMGNPNKNFTHILDLIVEESVHVRDNAMESSRIAINRFLVKKLGKDGFFMKIRRYPFQILRENKQAQGAHADRIQQGMSHAFGKAIGRAIRVKKGNVLISVLVDEKDVLVTKEALLRAQSRMPTKLNVRIGTDVESIGSKPKKVKAEKKAEKKTEEKEGEEEKKKEGEKGEKSEGTEKTEKKKDSAPKKEEKKK